MTVFNKDYHKLVLKNENKNVQSFGGGGGGGNLVQKTNLEWRAGDGRVCGMQHMIRRKRNNQRGNSDKEG